MVAVLDTNPDASADSAAAWRACIELRKTTAGRPGQASLFAIAET